MSADLIKLLIELYFAIAAILAFRAGLAHEKRARVLMWIPLWPVFVSLFPLFLLWVIGDKLGDKK